MVFTEQMDCLKKACTHKLIDVQNHTIQNPPKPTKIIGKPRKPGCIPILSPSLDSVYSPVVNAMEIEYLSRYYIVP